MTDQRQPVFMRAIGRLAFVAVLVLAATGAAAQIVGTLSNFDAHNDRGEEMTNLELDLRNIFPFQIYGFYQGPDSWGIPPIVNDVSGTEVTWADFRGPIQPGELRHFGLRLTPDAPFPCGVQAYWTRHLKIIEIPVPWQTWRLEPGAVVDVIRLNPDFPEPVAIQREFTVQPVRIPLDEMNWDNPDIGWIPYDDGPITLAPGDTVELPINLGLADEAALVRYTVALRRNPDDIVTRFVNEAEIDTATGTPTITGTLSNFDVHNDTGKPVHDLELDLVNVQPSDILDWYRGPNGSAWGIDPVIGSLPDGTGTEVTWVDEWNPIPYSETRHFGLRLNPENQSEPLVRAYWTRIVKVWQIPVPWQWWDTPPGNIVRDIIQLSDTFDGPVIVNREWTQTPVPVPLDDLVWDLPGVTWVPDPANPIVLNPGDEAAIDIVPDPVGNPQDPIGILVRYTVEQEGQVRPETRFINEAEVVFDDTGVPVIRGTLSNFDVINLTQWPVTNLELDFRGIQPHHILDWYRGQLAWGLHPVSLAPILAPLPQTEVTWASFRDPLPHCETRHFGIGLCAGAEPPCGVQAYWTQHRKIAEIPVPWQTWRPEPGTVIDVIRLDPGFPEPVLVTREYAVGDPLPLDELNWDNPTIPWNPTGFDPVGLNPGDAVELPIRVAAGDRAVFVRYTVALEANPGEIITRFVNEAEIQMGIEPQQIPTIMGTLSNFDVHNNTGKPVHDLELDLVNVDSADIWDWYRGPGAWGIDPVIRSTPGAPITEVTWVSDEDPIPHCEIRHFGLYLNPDTPAPEVRAFWTRQVKVGQIPVPWQFWLDPPGPFIRDVVQLSDTFTDPVIIRREYATLPEPVPLDDLNWGLPAPWIPDPAGPIVLQPGFQADLDIPVDSTVDLAVVVRYDVSDMAGTVITRFVNEAMLGPDMCHNLFCHNDQDMTWDPSCVPGAVYDMVRGDLANLRPNNGIADGTCVGEDVPDPMMADPTMPPVGQGYYYVTRTEAGGMHGTYDTTMDPLVREGRDAEIGGGDCI